MIGRRLRGPPLVSSCATGRRCTSAPIRRRTRRPSRAAREARLAVIRSDWGATPAAHDRSSAQCSGRRSRCGTGVFGGSGRLPTT